MNLRRILLALAVASVAIAAEHDLIIRHGRVLDGTGKPAISADVAVKDEIGRAHV